MRSDKTGMAENDYFFWLWHHQVRIPVCWQLAHLKNCDFEQASMDRGFTDFARWFTLHQAQAFFVTRGKSNLLFHRVYSRGVDKATGLRCDQTISLTAPKACKDCPQHLRRIKFYDAEHDRHLVFLTNNFDLPALTITQLYRCRWQVELFFKWIKQHLRIKKFYGTTENAVKT